MRGRLLIALLALLVAKDAVACSCGGSHSFLSSVRPSSLVFVGTVREYMKRPESMHPYAMRVEVESVLQGQYGASRITIWGDGGAQCLPYVSRFPIGTQWVFSVSGPTSIPDFGDENYHFDYCTANWLTSFDGNVYGFIGSGMEELTIPELCALIEDRNAPIKARKAYESLPHAVGRISAPVAINPPAAAVPPDCNVPSNAVEVDLVIDSGGNMRHWTIAAGTPPCAVGPVCQILDSMRFRPASEAGQTVSVRHRIAVPVTRAAVKPPR